MQTLRSRQFVDLLFNKMSIFGLSKLNDMPELLCVNIGPIIIIYDNIDTLTLFAMPSPLFSPRFNR